MAKILMVNMPYAGHINPTLGLAKTLVQKGHMVSYINAPEWREQIEATGADFIPYFDYPTGLSAGETARRCLPAAYNTTLAVGVGYDLLIYDAIFFLGKALAERLHIPCVRQISTLAWNEITNEYAKKQFRLWTLSLKILGGTFLSKKAARQLNMPGANLKDSSIHDVPPCNLVYTTKTFQPYYETFDERFFFVGPSISSRTRGRTIYERAIPYTQMRRPIIYISMGSVLSSRLFCRKCLRAFADKEVSVIISTGKVAPESLGPLPSNCYAYSFVPQLEVLQHASLFITHGGMNSVNEAIYYGVPMLVVPICNDQPINAAQVERLQLGKRISAFTTTAKMLYVHAMKVLNDTKIKENVKAMQQRMHTDVGLSGAAELVEASLQRE